MDTPPSTTISTPSPTELHDKDPVAAEAEKAEMLLSTAQKLRPIYLIVATTPCKVKSNSGESIHKLGIGLDGKLPWPSVKADMKYFKDVTQNVPATTSTEQNPYENTVIMGRKTYFSIPPKFRPLMLRQNAIITRSAPEQVSSQIIRDLEEQSQHAKNRISEKYGTSTDEATISTIEKDQNSQQWKQLQLSRAQFVTSTIAEHCIQITSDNNATPDVLIAPSPKAAVKHATANGDGQIFCIGGAEVYSAFLADNELRPRIRILQTEIETVGETVFQCDTFWPENFQEISNGWEEVAKGELTQWTGIEVPQGEHEWHQDGKANVRLRVKGWRQTVPPS